MTREEMWNSIEKLSELRSRYSCFDEDEKEFYHALSLGIKGIKALEQEQTKWIPISERPPKADEYIGNVAKYYLVQNEYGDMLVARYTHSGYWEQIYQLKPISDEIVAWRSLPGPYETESEE